MRFKATFILLGILVLLSAYVYFVEIQGKEKKDRIEEKASQLLALEQEDINKLSLKRANETITLERVDDEWYLISPVTAKGDANTVESFISTISETKKEREIETENDEVSLKDFGLLPALFTVIVEAEGGEADTVLFGEKNPTNLYIFARKPSNPNVFCTGTLVHTELQKTVFDLRDKTILPFDKESVHRIQIVSGNGEIVLARTDEIWMVESPIQAEADLQIVDSWLNNLHTSRIDRFEEENPTDYSSYGLDPPRIRLILTIGTDNTQKELLIGHRNNDEYYARDTALTPVFALDTTFVQDLDKDVFDFRDKTIAKIARDEVVSIELSYSDRPDFVCIKGSEDEWRIMEPDTAKAKSWRISSLLSDIIGMKATGFIGLEEELGRYGLDVPRTEIVLKGENESFEAHILIGAQSGEGNVFAMNRLNSWVYKTDSSIQEDLYFDIEEIAEESVPEQTNEQ